MFLFNVSEKAPSEETYDRWQAALKEAITKLGGKVLKPQCPKCQGTGFKHIHDAAHGIPGTHMDGSERFVCGKCDYSVYAREGKVLGFIFLLD